MNIEITDTESMVHFGERLGSLLVGGEVIELVGDVGAGKTTLTKGIAKGFGVNEDVQSPSFTISRLYEARHGLLLAHYDFYRLDDAGIMADELQETVMDDKIVTVIEWSGIVEGVLPVDRLSVRIATPTENTRVLTLLSGGIKSERVVAKL